MKKNKHFFRFIVVILVFLSTSCASYKILKLNHIDKSQKSITIPGVGFSFSEIKEALIADGWKIKASDAGSVSEKTTDKISKTNINYNSRYRMIIQALTYHNEEE